jgi:ABC-2 type transport system permease protein
MLDSFIVARKELIELLGNRHSARGALVQAGVLTTIVGVVIPSLSPSIWHSAAGIAGPFLFFPAMIAASVAADGFAGERERRTLETLLATPLSDGAIFAGKALTAVLFSTTVSALALAASVITVNVRRVDAGLFLPPPAHVTAVLGGAVGVAAVGTALAILVSTRVAVARSAQQMVSVFSMIVAGATLAILARLGIALDWASLPRVGSLLLAAGVLGLRWAMWLFRRDRIFEER